MMEKFKAARGFTLIRVVAITAISCSGCQLCAFDGTSIKNIKWAD